MDATKFYIELENSQFIVHASCIGEAIAMLWNRELNRLRDFTVEQIQWVRWSALQVEPEYFCHLGVREHGEYVHSRVAVPWLTGWQVRLVVDCLAANFGLEAIQDFFPTETELN